MGNVKIYTMRIFIGKTNIFPYRGLRIDTYRTHTIPRYGKLVFIDFPM